jgi:hypothetical protein
MKNRNIDLLIAVFLTSATLISCSLSFNDTPRKITSSEEIPELLISKKVLNYIQQSKTDSFMNILDKQLLLTAEYRHLEWLLTEGRKVLSRFEYPNDTSIMMSRRNSVSLKGKCEAYKFVFPFQNPNDADSLAYFHVSIKNEEVNGMFLLYQ